jgi:2-oxoglutarate ferredoxin oxidoreductase subunit delta
VLVMSEHTNAKGYHPPVVADESHCINCGLCALLCPDFAIYVTDGGTRVPDRVEPIHRIEVRR